MKALQKNQNMLPISSQMFGVIMLSNGDFDQLQYRTDLPIPKLKSGEVLIQVLAAAINNTDINTRIGWYSKNHGAAEDAAWTGKALEFPRIQGADVCGRIVAVGDGVDETRIGERVLIEPSLKEADGQQLQDPWYFGSECDGGFAQYTKVAARHAYAINSELSDVELASFPCSYSTAENLLTKAQVCEQDLVFVTGASGGVGSAVIQLAKARGAKVIAQTSQAKAEEVIAIGADRVVFRDSDLLQELGKNRVNVVIDLVGGTQWPVLLELLKPEGRYAVSGAIGGAEVELDLRTLYLKDLTFYGCTILRDEVFGNLIQRIEDGQIKPLVAKTYPLAEIVRAQQTFLTKQHTGKIVLQVG